MFSSCSKLRLLTWSVWLLASLFYAYQYILRVMPNIMLEDIMQQFQIDTAVYGQFSGVYYLGYSVMHLPMGIMLDRYGPKKIMTISILLTVIGLLPLIFAHHWIYPILGRVLIGIGSSAAILSLFKIIRMTFREEQFPRMLSFSVTIGLIGAIYGGGPVSYLSDRLGYQVVLQCFAIGGIILAFITFLIVPHMEKPLKNSIISDVKEVFSNRRVILSCLFAGFMVGPLEGFADVWGTAFLKQVYGFESTLAASLPSMIFIGMCFGAPLLSLIAEKSKNYSGTIISAGIVMAVSFFTLIFWPLSPSILSIIFVLVGACSAYQILAIYKVSTYVPEHVAGLTTAIANMIIMTFGYLFHTVIGWTISHMGGTHVSQSFIYGIIIIPIGLCIGVSGFTIMFIREKAQNSIQEKLES